MDEVYDDRYLRSHEQCMSVFNLQLNRPYFLSRPPIHIGQDVSWILQHRSAPPNPPSCLYDFAECPLPHHFVPGTLNTDIRSLLRRLLKTWTKKQNNYNCVTGVDVRAGWVDRAWPEDLKGALKSTYQYIM